MLKPNHAFEQFSRRIKESLFRPWKGTIYRVTTLKYADPRTMLYGEGSYRNGGRWNAIGSFRGIYGSTEDIVALSESKVTAAYANLPYPFREPRLIVALDVELSRVIDLTMDTTLKILGVSDEELRREDWRKCRDKDSKASPKLSDVPSLPRREKDYWRARPGWKMESTSRISLRINRAAAEFAPGRHSNCVILGLNDGTSACRFACRL